VTAVAESPKYAVQPALRTGRGGVGRIVGGIAWFIHHATWRMRLLENAWPLVEKELASKVAVPRHIRPRMWRRGFLGESWVLYDLRHNDWRAYLSDSARFARTRLINGNHAVLLDDKAVFHRFLGDRPNLLPAVHGIIRKGAVETPDRTVPHCQTGPWLAALAREHRKLIVKPCTGGGGKGVMVLRGCDAGLTLNERPVHEDDLRQVVADSDGSMVSECVVQHPQLAGLYPRTTNTLRVLTMQDDECAPFIAAAVLRIGSRSSEPTDNWTQGGLSAGIRLSTGRVGPAASYPAGRASLDWCDRHPDSGAQIAGTTVPHWPQIADGLLALMRTLPMLRYVGWDVAVTEDGFRILEGNNFSDVNLLQIHGPLLQDERVAAFYRRHGIATA
jgi:hypothetical protein